jgi:hypothetical protein
LIKRVISEKKTKTFGTRGSWLFIAILSTTTKKLVENSTFYHAYQLDIEDVISPMCFGQMLRCRLIMAIFVVIYFDSTYSTNRSHRPLAIISGFNHHRGALVFGATISYDETTKSYVQVAL